MEGNQKKMTAQNRYNLLCDKCHCGSFITGKTNVALFCLSYRVKETYNLFFFPFFRGEDLLHNKNAFIQMSNVILRNFIDSFTRKKSILFGIYI